MNQPNLQLNYLPLTHKIAAWTGDTLRQNSQVQWSVRTWNTDTYNAP